MALITASTALTIMVMNIHFCGAEARPVPPWARVVILKYMSRILFVYDVGESCLSPDQDRERDCLTKVYDKLPEPNLKTTRNKDPSRKKEVNSQQLLHSAFNSPQSFSRLDYCNSFLTGSPAVISTHPRRNPAKMLIRSCHSLVQKFQYFPHHLG